MKVVVPKALFLTTGSVACALGSITAKLEHLDGDESVYPHPLCMTPPAGTRRSS